MNDLSIWFVAPMSAMAGVGLGTVFFGGLWWTVRSSVSSSRPGLLVFVSLLLRLGVTLAGFYLVAGGQWQPLVACLLGFIAARVIIVRFLAPRFERGTVLHHPAAHTATPEITHAP